MSCKLVRRHLDAFVDGELDPTAQIDFERHLETCVECQEHLAFETSFRRQTREALGRVEAPEHLWGRALRRLDEIDDARSEASVVHARPMKWRQAWPFAAAAAALLVLGSVVGLPEGPPFRGASIGMIQDVVDVHSQSLPSDVGAEPPQEVAHYFRGKTPFPVRPAKFEGEPVELVGARYIKIGRNPAAALFYKHGGRRVTVLVFRDTGLLDSAQRTHVGGRELYYHDVGQRVVTIRQHDGLNYVFFGDLERPTMFQLAASARVAH